MRKQEEKKVQLPPFKVSEEIFRKFEEMRAKERTEKGGIPSRVEMFRRLVNRV